MLVKVSYIRDNTSHTINLLQKQILFLLQYWELRPGWSSSGL
jgi:hypothetical protein